MARVLSKIPVGKIKPLRVSQKEKLTQQKIGKETARKAANVAQYEKEKAARATTGSRYGYDSMGGNVRSAYTNTNARTFREFIEIAESVSASDVKLAQSGRISRNADALQREIDAVKGGKKPVTPNRSARRVTRQDFVDRSNVRVRREEIELDEKFTLAADKSKPQSPTPTKLPLSRERNIGKHDDWKDKPSTEWDDTPPAAKKLRSRANAVVGTQRRQDKETGVTEETAVVDKPATAEEKRKIALMQKLARLHAAAKGSKMVSDVAKEEYEIDEAKEAKPPQEVLNKISRAYGRKHKGVNVDTSHSEKSGNIRVNQLWVPPNQQGKGIGTRVMKGLGKYADKAGKKITLNQDPDKGKEKKLAGFYKSHGFEANKGDSSTRDTHIRNPKT
jgi:GNAT superfamily N-acetyltransferase